MTRRIEYGWRGADLDKPTPELEDAARQWLLWMQIDSDDKAGMMWGDLGRLDEARLQLQGS